MKQKREKCKSEAAECKKRKNMKDYYGDCWKNLKSRAKLTMGGKNAAALNEVCGTPVATRDMTGMQHAAAELGGCRHHSTVRSTENEKHGEEQKKRKVF